jgi:uncharacterized protein YggE
MRMSCLVAFALAPLAPLALPALGAQMPMGAAQAQLSTSATADVELKPDRATIVFGVESRGSTAAAAGAETARKQRAVIEAIKALGVAADQVSTANLDLHPELVYPGENKPPRVAGYVARNSIRVEVRNIEQTGAIIDAALLKEATGVGALQFSSTKYDEARRHALELAVAKAKAEADAMARAAGGTLGVLIEITAQPTFDQPVPVAFASMKAMGAPAPGQMPIETGQLKVSASITGRWRYNER